jgi:hypothetical protein
MIEIEMMVVMIMVLFAVAILAAAAVVVEVMPMNTMTTFACYSHDSISTSYVDSVVEKQRTGLNPSCTL